MMKRMCLIGVCIAIVLTVTGCGDQSAVDVLPYSLSFGDSYETAVSKNSNMSKLSPVDSDDSYISVAFVDDTFICDHFALSDDVVLRKTASVSYYFNQDEKLYEFFAFAYADKEGVAEKAFNEIIRYYEGKLGAEAETVEIDTGLKGLVTTERYRAEVYIRETPSGAWMLEIMAHDNDYDLDS